MTQQKRNKRLEKLKAELEYRKRLTYDKWLRKATPHYNWDYPHMQLLIKKLDEVLEAAMRGEMPRLIVCMPPRHGKSSVITERFPAYVMEKYPWFKWIIGAYNEKFCYKFSRTNRSITLDRDIRHLKSDSKAVSHWELEQEGGLRAAGIQSGVTGLGANGIIMDDPVKNRQEANSKVTSDRVYDEYRDSFMTRLEHSSLVIIILTRWSDLDLVGRITEDKEEAADWEILMLRAIAEEGEEDVLGRKPGEHLCPDLVPEALINRMKKRSPSTFESLYQQRPSAAGGVIFKRDWFKYWSVEPMDFDQICFSMDTAFEEGKENDYSVIQVWKRTPTGHYLIHRWKGKVAYPALKAKVLLLASKYKPTLLLIEKKASGHPLIQELGTQTRLPVVPYNPKGDKTSRAHACTPQFEVGNVYIPDGSGEGQEWVADYQEELCKFPNAAHDDDVDATTQYLNSQNHVDMDFSFDEDWVDDGVDEVY